MDYGVISLTCVFQPIPEPKGGRLIQVEGYWISVGDREPTIDETYILTSSVKLNLRDIVRVVSAGYVDLFSCCSEALPERALMTFESYFHNFPSAVFVVRWLRVAFLLAQSIVLVIPLVGATTTNYFGHL